MTYDWLTRIPLRWLEKIELKGGCFVWTAWNSGNGYGKLKVDGLCKMAHRAIYEFLFGPIPNGMVLDHKCRNRACVYPWHMEAVTPRENTLRGEAVLFCVSA